MDVLYQNISWMATFKWFSWWKTMFFQLFHVKDFTYRSTKYTYMSEWNRKQRNSELNDSNKARMCPIHLCTQQPVHNLSLNSIYCDTFSDRQLDRQKSFSGNRIGSAVKDDITAFLCFSLGIVSHKMDKIFKRIYKSFKEF